MSSGNPLAKLFRMSASVSKMIVDGVRQPEELEAALQRIIDGDPGGEARSAARARGLALIEAFTLELSTTREFRENQRTYPDRRPCVDPRCGELIGHQGAFAALYRGLSETEYRDVFSGMNDIPLYGTMPGDHGWRCCGCWKTTRITERISKEFLLKLI